MVPAWHGTLRRFLPGVWLGLLLCIALVATPAAFELVAPEDAGRIVRRIFSIEAPASLVLGVLLLVLERRSGLVRLAGGEPSQFTLEMQLALGALFCTVAGYYGLQPLFVQARAGTGPLAFGTVHLASTVLFGAKALLVAVLAWRAALGPAPSPRAS
jgi:hypothetical protein